MFKYFVVVVSLVLGATNCYAELVDPTQPPDSAAATQKFVADTKLVLSAIVISPEHQTAIINDQIVEVGDTIGEFQVIEIRSHSVKLHGPSGTFLLPLVEQPIKNQPRQKTMDLEPVTKGN